MSIAGRSTTEAPGDRPAPVAGDVTFRAEVAWDDGRDPTAVAGSVEHCATVEEAVAWRLRKLREHASGGWPRPSESPGAGWVGSIDRGTWANGPAGDLRWERDDTWTAADGAPEPLDEWEIDRSTLGLPRRTPLT